MSNTLSSALCVFTLAVTFSPGPATLMALARGTAAARFAEIVPFSVGCAVTYGAIWGAAAAFARYLATLDPGLFAAIRWVAIGLLLWIACRMLWSAFRPTGTPRPQGGSALRAALTGVGVMLCNPKCWTTAVVAAALFCDPELGAGGHAVVFGGLAGVLVGLSCLGYGWTGVILSARLNTTGGRRWLTVGGAILMAASVATLA